MWHLRHTWDKWTTIEEGNLLLVDPDNPEMKPVKSGTYLVQSRTCEVCDKKQLRTERTV